MMNNDEVRGAIIQARMGSTRFPGKVLKDLDGKPVLKHVIDRVKKVKSLDQIIVATTTKKEDDVIEEFCDDVPNVRTLRGAEQDVLDRFYQAAKQFQLDLIARITADNPLLDPEIIEKAIQICVEGSHQYVSNRRNHRYPIGITGEVFTFDALQTSWADARTDLEREHVTLYIRNNRDQFDTASFNCAEDLSHHRWTLDEPDDLTFLRRVFEHLDDDCASYRNILKVLRKNPDLFKINRNVEQENQLSKLKDREESN